MRDTSSATICADGDAHTELKCKVVGVGRGAGGAMKDAPSALSFGPQNVMEIRDFGSFQDVFRTAWTRKMPHRSEAFSIHRSKGARAMEVALIIPPDGGAEPIPLRNVPDQTRPDQTRPGHCL